MRRGVAAGAARGGAALLIPVTAQRNEAQDRWLARLAEHQARVRAWLAASRDPTTWGITLRPTRKGCGSPAAPTRWPHRASSPESPAMSTARRWCPRELLPPAIAGGSDDVQVARLIERAAANQVRALSWVRRARDPSAHMALTPQRREMLLRAIEHIATSRRLLHRAQTLSTDGALDDVLARHLAQLDAAAATVERLVHDLDEAQQA